VILETAIRKISVEAIKNKNGPPIANPIAGTKIRPFICFRDQRSAIIPPVITPAKEATWIKAEADIPASPRESLKPSLK